MRPDTQATLEAEVLPVPTLDSSAGWVESIANWLFLQNGPVWDQSVSHDLRQPSQSGVSTSSSPPVAAKTSFWVIRGHQKSFLVISTDPIQPRTWKIEKR